MKRLLPFTVVLAAGCNLRDPEFALDAYESCDALESSIKGQAMEEVRWAYAWGGGGFGRTYDTMESDDMAGAAPEAAMDGGGQTSNRDTSDTNTQVSGVDEADLMETDGDYIYSLAGDHLVITAAWPAESTEVVGKIALEGVPVGIYLKDDGTVVAVSRIYWEQPQPKSGAESVRIRGNQETVKTTVLDVSDPGEPVVQREAYTSGTYKSSRMIGDQLFVVSYSTMSHAPIWNANEKNVALKAVRESTLADWIPGRFDNIKTGEAWASAEYDVSDCSNIYGSDRLSGNFLVNVETLDTADSEGVFVGTSVLGSVDAIYMNHRSLYVVSQEADDGPWQSYDATIETVIHRFDIEGDAPAYASSGSVPGWVLNQFSMDEYDGTFRVATTYNGGNGWNDTAAGIYTLQEDGQELEVVGETTGMGEGENIFAVRFVEETGYVVTFEQIDPLYTIDLSDPTNPIERGELEITGFSNYMHPVGDDKLLAIGMEANANGGLQNVQVSLFDVSDLDNPTLQSRLQLDGTVWSEAQSDHHAFNYYAPKNVLLLPAASDYGEGSDLYLIDVDADADLSLSGIVDQDALTGSVPGDMDEWSWRYCTDFRRSVIIEDIAYGISNAGITAVSLDEPEATVASVPFVGIDVCAGNYGYW
jgi:uncharacterized secreted protein with C-terminal beta-propeller domain